MSEGGKLAETLAEAIIEHLNQQLKDSGKDNPVMEYLFGKNNELDFDKLVEMLRVMAMQVNLDQIKIGTLLEFANISMYTKYPEDRQFFQLIVQYLKNIEAQRKNETEEKKKETESENPDLNEMSTDVTEGEDVRGRNPLQRSISRLEIGQNKLMQAVEALKKDNKNIRTDIEDNEKRTRKRSIKMERSIKHTIKTRMGKLWSLFKKTLVIGLLLFFTPVLKKAFNKLGDLLSPVVDWFKTNFPKLYNYIKDLSAYVGSLASDFKWLTDKIKKLTGWVDENKTNIGVGAGALTGAGIGAKIGTMIAPGIGTAIGGLIGALIGGAGAAIAIRANDETDEEQTARLNAEAEKNQAAGKQALDDIYTQEIKRAIPDATDDEVKRIRDIYYDNTKIDLEHDNWFDKLNTGQRRLAEGSGKYSMNAGSWAEYAKAHPNASGLPTWDEWIQYIDSKGSSSSETSADVLESALDGKTTVEPSDEDTGGNSVAYSVSQNSTVNNYIVPPTENLWNTP